MFRRKHAMAERGPQLARRDLATAFPTSRLCSTRQQPPHRVDAAPLKPVAGGELVDTVMVTAQRRPAV